MALQNPLYSPTTPKGQISSYKGDILPQEDWKQRQSKHLSVIQPFTQSYRVRRSRGESHPIYDFLFTYYTFSTKKSERWHPGYGVLLEIENESGAAAEFIADPHYERSPIGISLSSSALDVRVIKQLHWVQALCRSIADRSPRFSCFGLHEWAMVYRTPDIRHAHPLRLPPEEIATFLERSTVCCSHFDAFRFFSPSAVGLNVLQPSSDTRLKYEQGGCLHANMDLYKWAYKLSPFVSSDLIRECFLLAVEIREIDMRASPYDFAALGFIPIRIETEEGQDEYRKVQQSLAERAQVLRSSLLSEVERILGMIDSQTSSARE